MPADYLGSYETLNVTKEEEGVYRIILCNGIKGRENKYFYTSSLFDFNETVNNLECYLTLEDMKKSKEVD